MKTDVLKPLEVTWEDWVLGGGALASFDDPSLPLHVEIGPGEDDFLLHSAIAHPGRNWLGIEYSRKRVRRYVRKVLDRAGPLGNLRLVWRPAADLIVPFLARGRVRAFHVHFPDPWPKKHHHRYRLLSPEFVAWLADALVPGGEIHVATDDREYAEAMLPGFRAEPRLESAFPEPGYRVVAPGERMTVFEERWRELGRAIHHLCFRRRAD